MIFCYIALHKNQPCTSMKKSLHLKLIVTSIFILLQSCQFNFNKSGVWKDDNIDPEVKNKINGLNQKLFEAFKNNDIAGAKQLMSQALIDGAGAKIDTLVNSIHSGITVPGFKVFNQFYVNNTSANAETHLFSGSGNSNDYQVDYVALNKQSYACLLLPITASSGSIMLVCYGKYDEGWKINIVYAGRRLIFGKTAPDYYAEAQDEYKKGNIINAADLISVAKDIAMPLSNYFTYENNDKMKDFYKKVVTEGNKQYNFPITVNAAGPGVQIFAITPQLIDDGPLTGLIPVVKYKTNIPIKDTAALITENKKLQKVIGGIFKGITVGNNALIYQAFDTIPDGKTIVMRYGILQRLQ
jgi:hypothetical protein